jgi:RNA polymerase sigma-70 factor (ECF subfamily)
MQRSDRTGEVAGDELEMDDWARQGGPSTVVVPEGRARERSRRPAMTARRAANLGGWTANSASADARERELLEAAHKGDEDAFRRLVETHRAALLTHCRRMLRSPDDAEDALQDTLLRAWRGLSGFDGRCALRGWLYRIATNVCLAAIARRPNRVLPIDHGPRYGAEQGAIPADALRMEPDPDQLFGLADAYAAPDARYERREAVELAFVMALERLTPRQRAVLVLREVLGFSAREVSQSLGTTVASVNSALQRARKAVDDRVPETSEEATARPLADAGVRAIAERFVDAFEGGEVGAIVALFAEDAGLAMPVFLGRPAVTPTIRAPRTESVRRFALPSKLAA